VPKWPLPSKPPPQFLYGANVRRSEDIKKNNKKLKAKVKSPGMHHYYFTLSKKKKYEFIIGGNIIFF
jgi:hypothetical protein